MTLLAFHCLSAGLHFCCVLCVLYHTLLNVFVSTGVDTYM